MSARYPRVLSSTAASVAIWALAGCSGDVGESETSSMDDRMAPAAFEASQEISLSGVSDVDDRLGLSSSAESFTVDKLYLKPAGTSCTTGSECMSRVCTSNFCSNVTPPDPLAWMTVMTANQPYGSDFLGLGGLSTKRVGGGIVGRGPKTGYLILGGFVLSACCYNSEWDFTFSDIGVPTLIRDFTLDILSKESTTLYFAPLRYDLVSASQKVTSGSVVYYNTNLYAPGYSRHDGDLEEYRHSRRRWRSCHSSQFDHE